MYSRLDRVHLRRYHEYSEREALRPGVTRLGFPYFMSDDAVNYVIDSVTMVAKYGWKLLPQVHTKHTHAYTAHTHTYTHIHTHSHTYTHTHTHTRMHASHTRTAHVYACLHCTHTHSPHPCMHAHHTLMCQ